VPPLKKIISGLLMPLLYANLAGLAAGAVWLGIMAQWQVIWIGIMALLFSPYVIPLLIVPAGVFSHFMAVYQSAGQAAKERRMFVLSLSYILLFLTLWCVSFFEYVTHNVAPQAIGAGLLWASCASMASLLLWASRDRNNIFITTTVETAQLAMVMLAAFRLLAGTTSFWSSAALFGGIMAVAAVTQHFYEKKQLDRSGSAPR
jgi:hypothetical protein